jgi:hypothetical protein
LWLLLHERPFPCLILLSAHCSGHRGEGNTDAAPQIRRDPARLDAIAEILQVHACAPRRAVSTKGWGRRAWRPG